MIETSICRTTEGLAALREEWEALERPGESYYTSHRFVSAWWASYRHAPGYRLHVVLVRQEGQLVGVGPFAFRPEKREGEPVTVLRWASHGDYLSVLHADGPSVASPQTISGHVLAELDRVVDDGEAQVVQLTGIPSESAFAWHVRTSQVHHRRLAFLIENPWMDLRGPWSAPSHTGKYLRKLRREHDVHLHTFTADEHGILDRIAEVHRAEKNHLIETHARSERHSLYDDDRRTEHIRQVFTTTDDALTFAFLDGEDPATGRVLAYRTVFRDGRRLLSWNSAYLPEFERYRMGKVLQLAILEHVTEHDLADEFDLGAGKYPWKFEWTPHQRPTYRYLLKPPRPPAAKPAPVATTSAATRAVTPAPAAGTARPPSPSPSPSPASSSSLAPADDGQPPWRRTVRRGVRAAIARMPEPAAQQAKRVARTRRLTRAVTVWYVPHPDDESIFMGGAIASEPDRRHVIVLLTPGEGSQAIHSLRRRLGREIGLDEFVAARDREFAAAVARLGVDRRDVHRVGLPDGGITEDSVLAVIRRHARRRPGAAHRTMSYLDPHPDHATAGRALRRAHRLGLVGDAKFFLPVPQVLDERAERVVLDERARAVKKAALAEYRLFEPEQGRYAIGRRSVSELVTYHHRTPEERVHGPELD
ncbi:GNAT family N-acetyltransferase [uncultured Serinicoccus sp.]|uniref:GNAT family N-acetyltransferase n=1 Tax=uncultured Serinicoccus sp. TaxID=735514 RepID=UPI0026282048|nr:GNAT family N-acetyltransferase [uncultured Serinicoccus sp.]